MVASVLKDNLWLDKIRRTGFFQFTLVNIDVRLCDITNCFYFASHQYCQLYCKMSNIPLQLCTDALIVSSLLTQREIVPETVDKRSLIAPLAYRSLVQCKLNLLHWVCPLWPMYTWDTMLICVIWEMTCQLSTFHNSLGPMNQGTDTLTSNE